MAMWQSIETAPRGTCDKYELNGVNYFEIKSPSILVYIPDDSKSDKSQCIEIAWWEPLLKNSNGDLGVWVGAYNEDLKPTHWMPLPEPPVEG